MGNVPGKSLQFGDYAYARYCQPAVSTEPLVGAWLITIAINIYLALTVYQALFSVLLHMIAHLVFIMPHGSTYSNYLSFSDETAEAQRCNLPKAT